MGYSLWSCTLISLSYCIFDLGLSTLSLSRGSWKTFIDELKIVHSSEYDFRTSQLELWIFSCIRSFCVILTVLSIWIRNGVKSHTCINFAQLLIVAISTIFASYSPVKILALYEFTHDLRIPYFWFGVCFNIYACICWVILWSCVLCKFKVTNVLITNEDTEQLITTDEEHVNSNGDIPARDAAVVVNGGNRVKDAKDKKEEEDKPKLTSKDSFILLFRLLGYCKNEWPLYVLGFSFLFCYSGARIFIPYYTGQVISNVIVHHSYPELLHSIGILSLLTLASGICGGLRGGCFSYAIARVSRKLRSNVFAALVKQEIGFFDCVKTGDITSRLTSDCQTIGDTVGLNTNVFLRNLVMFVGSFVIMFGLSWQMTTITFVAMPTIAIITKVYGNYVDKLSKETQNMLAKANEIADEVIGSMRTVRSFANEEAESYRYKLKLDEVLKIKVKQTFAYVGYVWSTEMFDLGLVVAVLWYGGHLVISGQIEGTAMVQILLYQLQLGEALIGMGYVFTGLMQSVGASRKVFEYIDRRPAMPNQGTTKPVKLDGRIDFRNVCFSYPARPDTQVLNSMSFSVSPGETVALVGPSGGGKSSCIALLQHLYEPSSGNVLIDGNPIHLFENKYLHTKMSLVGQEPVLYGRSIQENIAYGMAFTPMLKDLDCVEFTKIVKAAQDANAVEFIEDQPDKYDTHVGEKGVQLSGGQKQRIAIARALVRDPVILLLDEATSALDAESEHLVQEALYKNLKGHTVLLIAHRLSTVEKADRIVVIDKGTAVQQGTHQQLLDQDGIYRTLVSRQLLGGGSCIESKKPSSSRSTSVPTPTELSSAAESYRSIHSLTSSPASTPPNS